MDWHGSPTAVTGWPPPNSDVSRTTLGVAGVLVLVEQHDPEPVALDLADLGVLRGRSGRRARPGRRSPSPRARACALRRRRPAAAAASAGSARCGEHGPRRRSAVGCLGARRQRSCERTVPVSRRRRPGSRRCSASSPASASTSPVTRAGGPVDVVHRPVVGVDDRVRRSARPRPRVSSRMLGSSADPQRVLADQPRGVRVVGRRRSARRSQGCGAASVRNGRVVLAPQPRAAAGCGRASSPAALRVNVRPSTRSGRTSPLATSQTTRAAIVSVLPEPAPATTTIGAQRRRDDRRLLGVGAGSRSSCASSAACPRPASATG